jgi:hypothetical protein
VLLIGIVVGCGGHGAGNVGAATGARPQEIGNEMRL